MNGILNNLYAIGGMTFTVDTTVNEVVIAFAGTPDFTINSLTKKFARGDQIKLEGYEISLPYQFGQGSFSNDIYAFILQYRDSNGHTGFFGDYITNSLFNVPDPNIMYDTDYLIPTPSNVDTTWWLEVGYLNGYVSMINAPASLNTQVLDVVVHLKVRSNLGLVI